MKSVSSQRLQSQRGVASLLTALILLICITLVTLLTSKTVLVETKIAADNHRISQAMGAADYGMDFGINYFDSGGFDQDGTVGVDYSGTNLADLVSTLGSKTTFSDLTFDNTACGANGVKFKEGSISATGQSDDQLARRTISQCVGPINILTDDGPDQPLIAQGIVAVTGDATIINRYTNTTIWSGDKVVIGSSSAMNTNIKSSTVGVLDPNNPVDLARLLDSDPTIDAQLVSNKNLGNGLDIIDEDPSLAQLTGEEFFTNFFTVNSYEQLKQLAISAGQYYLAADVNNAVGKSGLIWIEGDTMWSSNGTVGTLDRPAIMVVNGDLQTAGTPSLYGLLYIVGKYTIGGTVTVYGSNIVEGSGVAAGDEVVEGNGTLNLVYWQGFVSNGKHPLPGLSAVISGSWRDW